MGSKKAVALRRLEAHNESPKEPSRREKQTPTSRHSESSRAPSTSCEAATVRSHERRETVPHWAQELLALNKETDRRLRTLEDEVKATGKRVSRKRDRSPVPEFKYKRNRTQYEFNNRVLNTIETALEASDDEDRTQALTEGKNLICERNKHIKLAKKFGWEMVECYIDEPLASDSDDEKRIRRAVKEGKALKEEKRKALKLSKPTSLGARAYSNGPNASQGEQNNRVVLKRSGNLGLTKDTCCFRCGRQGHLARFCKSSLGGPSPIRNSS